MKGGLVVFLSVFFEFLEFLKNERFNVIFIVVSDEEGFLRGSWEFIKSGRFDKVDFVFVGELMNEKFMFGVRGRFVIEVGVKGKKVYVVRFYFGINVIEEFVKFVFNFNRIWMKKYLKFGKGLYCIFYFFGLVDGLSVLDEVIVIIDRYVVVGEDWEKVRGEFYRFVERVGVRVEFEIEKYRCLIFEMFFYVVKENNRFVRWFKEVYREVERKSVEIIYGVSVGDFNYFGIYLSKLMFVFGLIGGNWYFVDEWVSVFFVRRVKGIYLCFLRVLVGFR